MQHREEEVKSLGVFYPRRAWGHARKIGKSSGGYLTIMKMHKHYTANTVFI